ncbi:SRPBCC family protein [Mariniflexile gromovii]|uniref:SRPBCC family protein n=1 Tax=Mariniflexile gromovii TaxID=362523 RepID=A0ABS4BT15_9FLAO|nr:SRPBCC family protein [Mariniflexile gromovii]MBP0903736.1 SRPBCC family protein [Mariniflexile gromovii]
MEQIKVQATVKASAKKVWDVWTNPKHIIKWNTASDDWHTTKAENDLRVGGKFLSRMEAKDGSFGFDFTGTYDEIIPQNRIAYTMDDGRKATTNFKENNGNVEIITVFDAESQNPIEMQRDGWQAIMNNFKNYTETN